MVLESRLEKTKISVKGVEPYGKSSPRLSVQKYQNYYTLVVERKDGFPVEKGETVRVIIDTEDGEDYEFAEIVDFNEDLVVVQNMRTDHFGNH